jgi:hypothetical protein
MPTSTSGPATGLDIACYKGDTFERWIRIRRNGVEEDLQPSSFRMQIRNAGTLVKEITSAALPESGYISVEVVGGGVLVLQIPAAVMATLPSGTFAYDLQQTYPDGKVRTRVRGSFSITDDITKPIS